MLNESNKTTITAAPIFTVIIPCWNAQATLPETLLSVQNQTFTNWEALLVDDGSTDSTPNIIDAYCAMDQRFKKVSSERKGPSSARNLAALTQARGLYLAFLDGDDLWEPCKLTQTMAYFYVNKTVDALYAQISFFRVSPLKPETFSTVYDRPLKPLDFLRDNPVCTMSNFVVKTDTFRKLKGFDETIIHNEDVEFLVRATANGAHVEGIDQHHVSYRTSLTGLSSDLKKMREGWYKAVETLQATPSRLTKAEIADADAGNLRYLARRALRTGAPGFEALHMAALGVSKSPRSFFSPLWRGGMTLLGAIAAPFLPMKFRKLAFSR